VSRRRLSSFAISTVLLGLLILVLTVVFSRHRVFTPVEETDEVTPHTIALERPRPVPPELDDLYREVGEMEEQGSFERAADRYLVLVSRLSALWGENSPDLIPYYFNFSYLLRAAGDGGQARAFVAEGLKKWPGDLRLEVLDISLRTETALQIRDVPSDLYEQLERVVVEKNYPYLRGLEVPPEAMLTQWAALLLEDGDLRPALAKADAALSFDEGYAPAQRVRGRILLSLGRSREAGEIFSRLLEKQPSSELEYYLGVALFDSGEVEKAYDRLSKLLASVNEAPEAKTTLGPLATHLRSYVARALVSLDRIEESKRVLLDSLVDDPYDVELLRTLAEAIEKGGDAKTAKALRARIRALAVREALIRRRYAVEVTNREAETLMLKGLIELSVDKIGGALDFFRQASGKSPKSARPHVSYGLALELLGKNTRADETYDEALQKTNASVLLLEKVRLAASEGRSEDARKILDDPRLSLGGVSTDDEILGEWVGRRLRAYLELADFDAVRDFLRENPIRGSEARAVLLSSAEVSLIDRRLTSVGPILDRPGSFRFHERSWGRALRVLHGFESTAGESSALQDSFDSSDLLDHARLLRPEAYSRLRAMQNEAFKARLEALRKVSKRRREIIDHNKEDADAPWIELFDLYREVGARRKARELAWFLLERKPKDVASYLRLARAIDRPEEVVERLSIVERGLKVDEEHAELIDFRAKALVEIGLSK